MKVTLFLCSSVSHIQQTAPLNLLISTMTTDAESFSKREWVKKLRQITLDKSSRAMSSESQVALIKTDLLWNKVSSVTTESNFCLPLAPVDIEPREKERERENLSEDALLVLISKLSLWFSSRREKKRSLGLPTKPKPEDLVQREPLESENFMESKKLKMKRPSTAQLL